LADPMDRHGNGKPMGNINWNISGTVGARKLKFFEKVVLGAGYLQSIQNWGVGSKTSDKTGVRDFRRWNFRRL